MKNKQKQPEPSLEVMCEHISQREIKAQKASRDSIKYMQCVYHKDKIGHVFKGIISSVAEFGLFVELTDTKAEGIVRANTLGSNWTPDLVNHCFKDTTLGRKINLGDEVHVVIQSVDIDKKNIELTFFY